MSDGLLKGKCAVVTGSTQGLGAAIARALVKEGARVAVSGRQKEKGEALAKELGSGCLYHPTDLTQVEDCRSLIRTAQKSFGGIDILVNSAATSTRSMIDDFTPELFDQQFYVNLRAPLLTAQAAIKTLRERNGVIINIGSVNSFMGEPRLLVYAATKGALQTASRNLAHALKFDRVRVYCLNVGWMDTEGERAMMAKLGHPPDFIDKEGAGFPLERILKPEEVADAVLWLSSNRMGAFSGAVIELEQFPTGPLGKPVKGEGVT